MKTSSQFRLVVLALLLSTSTMWCNRQAPETTPDSTERTAATDPPASAEASCGSAAVEEDLPEGFSVATFPDYRQVPLSIARLEEGSPSIDDLGVVTVGGAVRGLHAEDPGPAFWKRFDPALRGSIEGVGLKLSKAPDAELAKQLAAVSAPQLALRIRFTREAGTLSGLDALAPLGSKLRFLDIITRADVSVAELPALGELTSLAVSGATIHGELDGTKLPALRTLRVASDEGSDGFFESLGALSRLEVLSLFVRSLGDHNLGFAENLPRLQSLGVGETPVGDEGLIRAIQAPALSSLDAHNAKVTGTGLAGRFDAPQLRELYLHFNKLESLAFVAGAPCLEVLDIGHTPVDDEDIARLGNLEHMKRLVLPYTLITDRGMEKLAGLTALESLAVHHTKVTDAGLVALSSGGSLQVLDLSYTGVTGAGLVHLAGHEELRELHVGFSRLDGSHLFHIAGLGSLEVLRLSMAHVTDQHMLPLKGLVSLRTLALENTHVGGDDMSWASGMTKLEELLLSATVTTDTDLAHLTKLTKLETLDLAGTKVRGPGLRDLSGLSSLVLLDLSMTEVDDASMTVASKLTALRRLNLFRTKVTDATVRRLETHPLDLLSLSNETVTPAAVKRFRNVQPACDVRY